MTGQSKKKQLPGFNLERQNAFLKEDLMRAVGEVIESGFFIMGDNVRKLESEIAAYCGTGHAIGVANGSDALYLALLALDIGPGDEVITTPFTFYATAGSIQRCGATPVFADIEPDTLNIDPDRIEEKVTTRTKAIMPVHLYGCPAEMEPIMELAKRHGLAVVEDAAQALGAEYRGKKAGAIADLGCFSFFPTKNLGAFGDAGMIVTGNPDLSARVSMLRVHGARQKYHHELPGCNSRLDEIQAAVLRVKLDYFEEWTGRRREIAAAYSSLLQDTADRLRLPVEPPGSSHVYHQYTVQTPHRDRLQAYLKENGVGSTIYYPIPLHQQVVFASLGYREGDFPVTSTACREVLSLPMFPELKEEEIARVASLIKEFFSK